MTTLFLKRLSQPAREFLTKLLLEDRYTIDELLDLFSEKFPDEAPARSTMGRTKKQWDEHARKMKEVQYATEMLVGELGEDKDDKAGAFLVQGITTLVNNLILNQLHNTDDPEQPIEISIKDALALAKASRELTAARGMSIDQRQKIERIAREKLLEEQAQNLDEAVSAKGMTEEQAMFWREKILGIKQ